MVYIRQKSLPALKKYKYSGVDHSLVSRYILKPFYTNVVIKCFPLSMAPNLITLSGFTFVIANFLTLLWYSPTLDVNCPPWVYYSWAIGLFLYQTFDAVDGTQARRTNQSGPLGELFDHGVDALNTTLEVLLFAAAMNLGQGWKTVVTLFASLLTFYVQTWEEYHTKTLTLGLISGPVEGILMICFIFTMTGFLGGGSFWQQPMLPWFGLSRESVPFLSDWFYNLAWNDWYLVQGAVVLIFNTVQASLHVVEARRKAGKRTRIALVGLAPFFATWTLIPAYLYLQPKILNEHLIPFMLFAGIINAYSVGQMIVAHLTQASFPYWNALTVPVAAAVIDSLGPVLQARYGSSVAAVTDTVGPALQTPYDPAAVVTDTVGPVSQTRYGFATFGWPSALGNDVYQVAFVFSCLGLAIGVYGSFVVDVIVAICDHLDIYCLSIKHPGRSPLADDEKAAQACCHVSAIPSCCHLHSAAPIYTGPATLTRLPDGLMLFAPVSLPPLSPADCAPPESTAPEKTAQDKI